MKRLDIISKLMTVVALACALALSATANAATPVKNVMLAKSGDFTEVTVPVPSHQLCEHSTEAATAERPFRIVLNICNAEHAMPQQNFGSLPACIVQKIRTSQYSTTPDQIVRVVLDLKSSATYTVRTEENRLVIAIADPCPPFAAWEACPAPMMANAAKPETVAKKTEKPQIDPPASAASEPVTTKPSQSLALEPIATPTTRTEKPIVDMPSAALTTEDLVGPESQQSTPVSRMEMETETPAVTTAPMESFALPSQPLVLAPEVLDAANVGDVMTKPVETQSAPTAMPAFAGSTPQVTTSGSEPPMLAVTENQTNDVTLPPTVSSSDTLTGQDALIDRLKAKFFSGARAPKPYLTDEGIMNELKNSESSTFGPPSPGSDMDREALLERIRQAALQNESGIPANMLPSVPGGPARTEVFYDDLGRRDPFEPLLKGLRSGFLSDELPSVESLRMVGVLKDNEQSLALMEDTDGHSYIMRPGDPVNNGRVLSVGEARTIVQVDEYGWTRTVVLQLTSRGGDPSKSLGLRSASPEEAGEEVVQPPQGE